MSLASYAPAQGCDATLNAWCDSNCPHQADHGSLLARLDYSGARTSKAWRCYARSTLSEDGQHFVGGDTFCTRHAPLVHLLSGCLAGNSVHAAAAAATNRQPPGKPPAPRTADTSPAIRVPRHRNPMRASVPHYEHTAAYMTLPAGVRVPRFDECKPELVAGTRPAHPWPQSRCAR